MRIRVFPDSRAATHAAAERIAGLLRSAPQLVLALPTGRTAAAVYRELVTLYRQGGVDFSRASCFNLDEFVGLPPGAPGSYRQFLEEALFRHVNFDPTRLHCLNGAAPDLDAECARYERAIATAGGIDVLILGIGTNGHIGFNEPGPTLTARTHRATLQRSTTWANRQLFGGEIERVPRQGLTMGMATLLQARQILAVATGSSKARAVAGVVCGPLTTRLPASFLQLHGTAELLLDRAAARALPEAFWEVTGSDSPATGQTGTEGPRD